MADLPSIFTAVNDVEVAPRAPVTEALHKKLGQNDNYLKGAIDQEILDRDFADVALQAEIDDVRDAANTLINIPHKVASGAVSTAPHAIGDSQRVAAIWFEKRTGVNETYLKIQLFNDDGDDMIIDSYTNLSFPANGWDYGNWYFDQDADEIAWSLYEDRTIAI